MVRNAAPNAKLVAYERVSTARQGKSGLGLEAQMTAIDDYAQTKGGTILARFTEVESGRKNDRPELDHGGNARHCQARPPEPQRGVPADAPGCRGQLRGLRQAGSERPDRGHHGPRCPAGAGGDLAADEGGVGGRKGPRGEAGQPERRGGAHAGREGRVGLARDRPAECGRARGRAGAGGGGAQGGRSHDAACLGGCAQCSRHDDQARRAMACVERQEHTGEIGALVSPVADVRTECSEWPEGALCGRGQAQRFATAAFSAGAAARRPRCRAAKKPVIRACRSKPNLNFDRCADTSSPSLLVRAPC
jgi:hypothetical protein